MLLSTSGIKSFYWLCKIIFLNMLTPILAIYKVSFVINTAVVNTCVHGCLCISLKNVLRINS